MGQNINTINFVDRNLFINKAYQRRVTLCITFIEKWIKSLCERNVGFKTQLLVIHFKRGHFVLAQFFSRTICMSEICRKKNKNKTKQKTTTTTTTTTNSWRRLGVRWKCLLRSARAKIFKNWNWSQYFPIDNTIIFKICYHYNFNMVEYFEFKYKNHRPSFEIIIEWKRPWKIKNFKHKMTFCKISYLYIFVFIFITIIWLIFMFRFIYCTDFILYIINIWYGFPKSSTFLWPPLKHRPRLVV